MRRKLSPKVNKKKSNENLLIRLKRLLLYQKQFQRPSNRPPYSTYLQVAVPGCIYYGPFQLESINKRNQRGQTRKLNALINLSHLHEKNTGLIIATIVTLFMCNFMVTRGSKNYDHCPGKVKKKKNTEVQAIQFSTAVDYGNWSFPRLRIICCTYYT